MQHKDLQQIRDWFNRHVSSYLDMDPEGLKNILLKQDHTLRVLDAMQAIAAGEGLDESETITACTVALLHDTGRFPQYRRWRTFRDSESDNHARLGIEVIREQGVLDHLSPSDRLLIEEAIRFHNLLALPDHYESPTNLFIRLIRDADKLDIWRVFLDYFRKPEEERATAAGLGFSDEPGITADCVGSFAEGRVVRLDDCKILNDFRVLQMSWVYDLNFSTTYRLLDERNYIAELASGLPDEPLLREATARAVNHVKILSGNISG